MGSLLAGPATMTWCIYALTLAAATRPPGRRTPEALLAFVGLLALAFGAVRG